MGRLVTLQGRGILSSRDPQEAIPIVKSGVCLDGGRERSRERSKEKG